jgi:hypothetical protein
LYYGGGVRAALPRPYGIDRTNGQEVGRGRQVATLSPRKAVLGVRHY